MARGPRDRTAADRFVVVDKPGGMTSHDVVGAARRALGTRRVGHAGTLDPMATGVLVLGVERATRLLRYVSGLDKTYQATVRLGVSTTTDDAEGEVVSAPGAATVGEADITLALQGFRGTISQRPSAVSAIKVDGRRAHDLVRSGIDPDLAAREVVVHHLEMGAAVRGVVGAAGSFVDVVDVSLTVTCSSGTYVRAIARDLGTAANTGGHIVALRRTVVGPYGLDISTPVAGLDVADAGITPLQAMSALMPTVVLDAVEDPIVRAGGWIAARLPIEGPHVGLVDPAGALLAVARVANERWQPEVVLWP